MLPNDLIRAAIKVLDERGWCQAGTGHCRDANGEPCSLFRPDRGGESRASINPAAVSFSAYGAIVVAQQEAAVSVSNPSLMWDVLYRLAREANDHAPGGENHVHPLLGFNNEAGRTKAEVMALMEKAAAEIEAATRKVSA